MPTLAQQLTGKGAAAIAVVAVRGDGARGDGARGAVNKLASGKRIAGLRPGEISRATLRDGESVIDDALVVCINPEHFELHLHGGQAVMAAVLAALAHAGAEVRDNIAPPGIQGEVEAALTHARTMLAARLLSAQVYDGMGTLAAKWQPLLDDESGHHLWKIQSAAQWILQRSRRLEGLLHGVRIAIAGCPNAGKSTLINALAGRSASITSDIPGTTRDWVEAAAVFLGPPHETNPLAEPRVEVPVVLVDTAGVRDTADTLEELSIERARQQAAAADLVLVLLDGPDDSAGSHLADAFSAAGRPVVVAVNKIDLGRRGATGEVGVSALLRTGLDDLMAAVLQELDLLQVADDEPFCFTQRQQRIMGEIALAPDVAATRPLLHQLIDGRDE